MNSSKHGLINSDNLVREQGSLPAVITQTAPRWVDAPSTNQGIRIASYLEIPFMHKRLILSCVLLGLLLGWVAILLWPRSYESVAKLMVKVGRENVSLDPTATTGTDLMVPQKTQEEEVVTVLEVLNSRKVAESVVDAVGVEAVLSGQLAAESSGESQPDSGAVTFRDRLTSWKEASDRWLYEVLSRAGMKDDVSDREIAVQSLQKSLQISSPKKSSVVVVEMRSGSPEVAQAIVRETTKSFVEEHLRGSHTEGSFEFFEEQAANVEQALNEMVAARSKFMQDHKIVSIEANRELLRVQLAGINRDLVVAYGDLERATAKSKDLAVKNDLTAGDVIAERRQGEDSTWSGMRQQIYELELEEQRAAAVYTASHPELRRIRSQLAGASKILGQLQSERVDLNTTPNPVKIGLGNQLQQEQTAIAGLLSEIKEKESRQATMQHQIDDLLDQERHLLELDRDIRLAETNLEAIRMKREEARILDELHTNKFSNIHVFQPASFVERAVSPVKKILGVGFVMLGLVTGLTLSFLREASSPAIRTSEDVEYQLAAPVISNIPRLKRMKSHRVGVPRAYRQKCRELMADILMTQHFPGGTRGRSIGILGVDVGAGASTLAVNLALSSDLDCHLKTVLVDADSRNRSVSKMFGLNGSPGLVELLSGAASHDECLQKVKNGEIELIASSADSNRETLTNTGEEIVQALDAYLQDCDLLIVDLPAASQPDQAVALAQHLDCLLIVAESEKTQFAAADRLLNRMYGSNTEVLGVVLTKTRSYLPRFMRPFVAPQV